MAWPAKNLSGKTAAVGLPILLLWSTALKKRSKKNAWQARAQKIVRYASLAAAPALIVAVPEIEPFPVGNDDAGVTDRHSIALN
ncbi:hypothetical protein [Pseudomonas nicosulfuronedens]